MKAKLFCLVLCTSVLFSCEKELIIPEEPVKPPVEQPEEPEQPEKPDEPEEPVLPGELPSTDNIINFNNEFMIVGANKDINWRGITYGNGKYVAVGYGVSNSGFITTSTDGENWSPIKTEGMKGWYNVAYGNGKFVVVGSATDSYVISSFDGENWSELIDLNLPTGLKRLAFGNGVFVVVSRSGTKGGSPIITSTNGINWTKPVYIDNDYDKVNDVVYGDGKFVAVGITHSNINFSITSTDGKNWSTLKTIGGTRDLYAIGYGNGKFVGGTLNGEIVVSTDGVNWSPIKVIQSGMQIMDITYGKGKFIMACIMFNPSGGYVLTSVDGENWSEPQQVSNNYLNDICVMP